MLGYRRVTVLVLLCLAAFGGTATQRAYLHDDSWIVDRNALLDAGAAGAKDLVSTGYWEAAQGAAARVRQYRPLLMLTFLAQRLTTGRDARPMHAANVLLHALACVLVLLVLSRKLPPAAAYAGALAFAVMPSHAEAVAALTGRSELLVFDLLLGAWLLLERPETGRRLAAGGALFCAALFVKEHALLFPLFLALSDWTFDGALPWSRERRRVHAVLLAAIAACLLLRLGVLSIPFAGGEPYFADRLTAALTVARFAFTGYLWPSLTGLGLCPDFAKPLIPDSPRGDLASWPPLLMLGALYAAAAAALLRRRARWAFWLCAPSVFLLPTIHVLAPLDTIGAQRFLYLPSLGLAAGLGAAWARAHAARPRLALAAGLLAPGLALPYYNLARRAWERGDAAEAARRIAESLERDPGSPDAWTLSALIAQSRGRPGEAEASLRRALALAPWSPAANFNLARLELASGRSAEARAHLRAFARFAPGDPDAPWALRVSSDGPLAPTAAPAYPLH